MERCRHCGLRGHHDMSICEAFHDREATTRFSPLRTAAVTLALLSILGFLLVPNFIRARAQGRGGSCMSNLNRLATALNMYAVDNDARFPADLRRLLPSYLRAIPNCPTAQTDTYSHGYLVTADARQFLLYCRGDNHHGVGLHPNYPQYSARAGLLIR